MLVLSRNLNESIIYNNDNEISLEDTVQGTSPRVILRINGNSKEFAENKEYEVFPNVRMIVRKIKKKHAKFYFDADKNSHVIVRKEVYNRRQS